MAHLTDIWLAVDGTSQWIPACLNLFHHESNEEGTSKTSGRYRFYSCDLSHWDGQRQNEIYAVLVMNSTAHNLQSIATLAMAPHLLFEPGMIVSIVY